MNKIIEFEKDGYSFIYNKDYANGLYNRRIYKEDTLVDEKYFCSLQDILKDKKIDWRENF